MPIYEYRCSQHGLRTIRKPMAEAHLPVDCPLCIDATPMTRIYSGQAFIVRPTNWDVRPGDPRYSDFRREGELGELRSAPQHRNEYVEPELLERKDYEINLSGEQTRELRQLSELVDREIRASADVPELVRED
jgi:putative FmdB family regulatory protein